MKKKNSTAFHQRLNVINENLHREVARINSDFLKVSHELNVIRFSPEYRLALLFNKIAPLRLGLPLLRSIASLVRVTHENIQDKNNPQLRYQRWISVSEPKKVALDRQKKVRHAYSPRITILLSLGETTGSFVRQQLDSICAQTYSHWEACVFVQSDVVIPTAIRSKMSTMGGRFSLVQQKGGNSDFEMLTNSLGKINSEFVCIVDSHTLLSPFALFEFVQALQKDRTADVLYSDDDFCSPRGTHRHLPNFKPDFSLDMLRGTNYIGGSFLVRRTLGEAIGWMRLGTKGFQRHDYLLRLSEKTKRIAHIPKVLFHRTVLRSESGDNKRMQMSGIGERIVSSHLARTGVSAIVKGGLVPGSYRICYRIPKPPLVSIIILNHNQAWYLDRLVRSILRKTRYPRYEICIVENNSTQRQVFNVYHSLEKDKRVQVVEYNKKFNYAHFNNFAASRVSGSVLLFLNNDMDIINGDWLEELTGFAIRHDVGAVGAKLLYEDDTCQHCGVILGIQGVAGHSHKGIYRSDPGYGDRAVLTQNLSAVSGACLMMRRDVFQEVGGFDKGYALAFNDVDICRKVRRKGYSVVWTPFAELYHFESKTRGLDTTIVQQKRFLSEINRFKRKWGRELSMGDPFYSRNLTLQSEDFAIRGPAE